MSDLESEESADQRRRNQKRKGLKIQTPYQKLSRLPISFAELTLISIKWVLSDPSTIFLATNFTQKMLKSSGSMYSSIFLLENILYHHFTWSKPNSEKILKFVWVPRYPRPQLEQNLQFLVISVHFR